MPKNLVGLTIAAIDELACLLTLQRMLQICLEQLDDLTNPRGEAEERVGLLVGSYLSQSQCHLEELEMYLDHIKRLLVDPSQSSQQ